MPLKIVRIKGRPHLICRGTVFGQKVYESTKTNNPGEAESFRVKRESEIWHQSVHGKRATRVFADAAASYIEFEPRSKSTIEAVERLLGYFEKVPLDRITQDSLDGAFRKLLEAGANASPQTKIRAVITPLQAVLSFAARRGWCNAPAFEKPTVAKTRMDILFPHQVDELIRGAAPHLRPLLTFLAGTGCRPSEAFELTGELVDLKGAQCQVQQKQGDWRRVRLCPRTLAAIAPLVKRGERVFKTPARINRHGTVIVPPQDYRTGDSESGQIKKAWATACRNAGFPGHMREWRDKHGVDRRQFVPEYTPYILRHTWASWEYCVSKDLLAVRMAGNDPRRIIWG